MAFCRLRSACGHLMESWSSCSTRLIQRPQQWSSRESCPAQRNNILNQSSEFMKKKYSFILLWSMYTHSCSASRMSIRTNIVYFSWFHVDLSHQWLISIPTLISNYIPYKMGDDISWSFTNFFGATIKVWECIINFTTLSTPEVITYPCKGLQLFHVSKMAHGYLIFRLVSLNLEVQTPFY